MVMRANAPRQRGAGRADPVAQPPAEHLAVAWRGLVGGVEAAVHQHDGAVVVLAASRESGRPKRYRLAHASLWDRSYKRPITINGGSMLALGTPRRAPCYIARCKPTASHILSRGMCKRMLLRPSYCTPGAPAHLVPDTAPDGLVVGAEALLAVPDLALQDLGVGQLRLRVVPLLLRLDLRGAGVSGRAEQRRRSEGEIMGEIPLPRVTFTAD